MTAPRRSAAVPDATKWPKRIPPLTEEQQRIRDEFMYVWHEQHLTRFTLIERFNHGYPARQRRRLPAQIRTLEIGAGLGEHLEYEPAEPGYHAVELRPEMAAKIQQRFPQVQVVSADCQEHLPFDDGYFDRVLAIHVLEHLPNLPAALREAHRVLKPGGQFCVVIPCEGGLAYTIARNISARRVFERRFRMPYDWCISSEHINVPAEILAEADPLFEMRHRSFFPLLLPAIWMNLCIGITFAPRPGV
ncbi:class I SAM-dependent methyltransferase [Desertibaculum subflavum]|uniref:class I SAM-dependent methyltransferase n=1 Tax=Desertibaculum subflavum TaxID=2268458 RepID=UPI000E66374F